jgi:hypothetical protein
MRAPLICCLLTSSVCGQTVSPVQQIVESLYPKSQRLKETRLPDLVRLLNVGEGTRVADVGCGSGEFSVILSRVVGPSGRVWCEDIRSGGAEIKKHHVRNAVILRGADDDPKLPAASLATFTSRSSQEGASRSWIIARTGRPGARARSRPITTYFRSISRPPRSPPPASGS